MTRLSIAASIFDESPDRCFRASLGFQPRLLHFQWNCTNWPDSVVSIHLCLYWWWRTYQSSRTILAVFTRYLTVLIPWVFYFLQLHVSRYTYSHQTRWAFPAFGLLPPLLLLELSCDRNVAPAALYKELAFEWTLDDITPGIIKALRNRYVPLGHKESRAK